MLDLNDYIVSIPDFPEKGIIFRDITPLWGNAEAYARQHIASRILQRCVMSTLWLVQNHAAF